MVPGRRDGRLGLRECRKDGEETALVNFRSKWVYTEEERSTHHRGSRARSTKSGLLQVSHPRALRSYPTHFCVEEDIRRLNFCARFTVVKHRLSLHHRHLYISVVPAPDVVPGIIFSTAQCRPVTWRTVPKRNMTVAISHALDSIPPTSPRVSPLSCDGLQRLPLCATPHASPSRAYSSSLTFTVPATVTRACWEGGLNTRSTSSLLDTTTVGRERLGLGVLESGYAFSV